MMSLWDLLKDTVDAGMYAVEKIGETVWEFLVRHFKYTIVVLFAIVLIPFFAALFK